jgi:folate-binding protein YgfZ
MLSILKNRTIVKITGEDAAKFLQNLVTNDVFSEEPIYAMMLSSRGRFLFDMFIFKIEEDFLLDIENSTKDIFVQKLNLYKINMKVSIEHLDSKICYSRIQPDTQIYYKDPRFNKLGYRFITQDNIVEANSYIEDKYKYTIPDGGVDLLYDKAMPQEYGAEEMHAISFTKGCYIGQEVISRTKTQGQVRKKIYKITAGRSLENIPHGTEITENGAKIGIFCSGFGNIGIGLIREENIDTILIPVVDNIEIKIERAEWYR